MSDRRRVWWLLALVIASSSLADGKGKKSQRVDQQAPRNIYADDNYSGCEGGFCPAEDPSLEEEFWKAAEQGNTVQVRKLLDTPGLNISRNIVPDEQGHTRVVDVAVWAAAKAGHAGVVEVIGWICA